MAKIQGTAVRLYINTGTEAVPVYTALDCETSSSFDFNVEYIETTGKCDDNWKNGIPGIRSWGGSVDVNVDEGDAAYERLLTDLITSHVSTLIQWKTFNSKVVAGTALITTVGNTAETNGVVTASITFEGVGAITRA